MKRRTLLIVDDEVQWLAILKPFFERRGYLVWVVTGEEAALRIVDRHQPQVVLLDLSLGDAPLRGLEVLQQIRARWPDIAVFMWSGSGDAHTRAAALQFGADRFFDKPLSLAEVLRAVQAATDRAPRHGH